MKKIKQDSIKTYEHLLQATKKHWMIFVFGTVCTIVISLTDAGFAWLVKPIINRGFIIRNTKFVRFLPFAILTIFLFRGMAGFLSTYFISRVARSVVMDFRRTIFNHLLCLPAKFYDQNSSGYLLSTVIYSVEQIAQASSDALVIIFQESSLIIGLLMVMFLVNWELTSFFLISIPIIILVMKICSMRLRRLSTNVQQSVAEVAHIARETIESYKVVRLFGGQTYENEKFHRATKENQQHELKVVVTNSINNSLVQLLIAIPIATILFFSTQSSLHMTAGSFASVISAMTMMLRPMRRLTTVNSHIQKGISGVGSIVKLLDESVEKNKGNRRLLKTKGTIEYSDVSFSYDENQQFTLSNINLTIEKGQMVALVGRSGAGKSTLINLLPRFYEVSRGVIKIDGINIKEFHLKELRNQFALVSQNAVLFNDTILNNIAYGQVGRINKKKIIEAARAAYAMEFIEQLPEGLNTIVGENGVLLSGGQKQRIVVARALFKNAPIFILDEAMSAIDTYTERHIQASLENLMRQRTTLIIAHRLSTLEKVDWIVVMDKGKIVETGTHQQLLTLQGMYAKLHQKQSSKNTVSVVREISESKSSTVLV
ncbi:lipid A export permease/ATP-binding protein MsbA [Coxiella-like endosymbiont of Amblyomma americanum]|uniref:lipid A export permease/ATP-binding protein MsbA n=1 Tax=Coxiella-like endosymbiont of Amblyomma americanum TaxID=1987500 RepID=UPI0011D15F00|nr:lipid A export permease/ATP-binding protein MsbA [Coxiella-like endosymbiont of Amblyomma americanum]